MNKSVTGVLGFVLALIAKSQIALAACGDPPAPGVDWSDCVQVAMTYDGADLSNANLQGLLVTGSVLTNTNFKGANLTDTRFATTDLSGSDFSGTRLTNVSFNGIRLRGAFFRNAALTGVSANNVNATEADFHGAEIVDSINFMLTLCRTVMPDGTIKGEACD